ncbi:MAG: hypothetical protein QOD83_4155 [Solirubrobacteraceae bacterium]|jgi:hypothetical protein|nr:hypothetical protein [Solirubrobacteraceae bacterium]MEA2234339.1 hypothetical protein [Solirubrobacteraceae bacterium]
MKKFSVRKLETVKTTAALYGPTCGGFRPALEIA